MKVVLLNGPPRSGKDAAAEELRHTIAGVVGMKFAAPLGDVLRAFFELEPWEYNRFREEKKDLPQPRLLNKSMREVMISVSETWAKPTFGPDVFGRIAAVKLLRAQQKSTTECVFVFSDCGFEEEVQVLAQAVCAKNCFLLRLHRDGCTFEGDSRSYIPGKGMRSQGIRNNGSLHDLRSAVTRAVRGWLEEEEG